MAETENQRQKHFPSAAGPSLWDPAPSLVTNTKLNVCGDKLREGNNPC